MSADFSKEEIEAAARKADELIGDDSQIYSYQRHGYSMGILNALCALTRAEAALTAKDRELQEARADIKCLTEEEP